MGCNCGGSRAKPMNFEVTVNGQKKVYRTEVEARAALLRANDRRQQPVAVARR